MPPNQEPEDFIPLTDSNLTTFETTSQPSTSPSPEPEDSPTSPFTPSTITRTTIQTLVSAYPSTIERIYRQKLLYKVTPQPTKGEKKRAQCAAGNPSEPVFKPPTEADLDKGQLKYVENEMEKFRELDGWRYEHFPGVLGERVRNGKGVLGKEEIIRVMDWKTKHGLPRPTLMGMIKTNKEKAVQNATSAALASLPSPTTDGDGNVPGNEANENFPNTSLDKLSQPLRGVGPATASLILSIATGPPSTTTSSTPTNNTPVEEIPFYSDDTFLWLVLSVYPGARKSLKRSRRLLKQVKPNGELNVKYNMHEYRELWTAVRELRERLATESTGEGEDGNVSTIDIEKAAFVIRHLDVSGLNGVFKIAEDDGEGGGGGDEEEDAKERAKLKAKAKAKEEKDRKKREKREREMERKEKRKRDDGETPAEKKERKKRKYNNRR